MIKRISVAIMLLVSIILTGCTPIAKVTTNPSTNEVTPQVQQVEVPGLEAKMNDIVWISPAEVKIGNYYSGAEADWNIKIHNGNNTISKFAVTYRIPDHPREGYNLPPTEAQDWVIIADTTPIISAKETKEILVKLVMPKDAKLDSKQWEFWVSVVEGGQGLIQTEMCIRFLVNMR